MSASSLLAEAARRVLAHYPCALQGDGPVAQGNRGGYSGARLWRVATRSGERCLRAWPPADSLPHRLGTIHRLMMSARHSGLHYVPAVVATRSGATWVEDAGRLWDLTTWQPGQADFHQHPTPHRLEEACRALARLHTCWASETAHSGSCPAIQRRQDRARAWKALVQSGWRPRFSSQDCDPIVRWAERAWHLVAERLDEVAQLLAPLAERVWRLHPCLCDVWHDHLLFDGDTLTGLVDYGSIKLDHLAVDLARLLGSLVEDDAAQRTIGVRAYSQLRPLSAEEEILVDVLDRTGTVLAAANWLQWLYQEGRCFEDRNAVASRLATLVGRLERWH